MFGVSIRLHYSPLVPTGWSESGFQVYRIPKSGFLLSFPAIFVKSLSDFWVPWRICRAGHAPLPNNLLMATSLLNIEPWLSCLSPPCLPECAHILWRINVLWVIAVFCGVFMWGVLQCQTTPATKLCSVYGRCVLYIAEVIGHANRKRDRLFSFHYIRDPFALY